MKPAKFGSCAIAYGFTLCLAIAQSPSVLTPGTSTEIVEAIGTGTRTTFSLTGNTILSWDQLTLPAGSELVYDFQSGDRVLNLLTGSNRHRIEGTVTSNGTVGFFSPNAHLNITGTITAKGVILSTLNADPDEFFKGAGFTMNGGGNKWLFVGGRITATEGDVILAGSVVSISSDANIEASDSLLVGGGSEVSVSKAGERGVSVGSDDGNILHMGNSKSQAIEIVSGGTVINGGRIDAGNGRVFIDVGPGMEISNESPGVIVAGSVFTNAAIVGGSVIIPDEGDSAPTVGDGTLNMPALTRPDGRIVSQAMKVSSNAPVSASGDGGRDARKAHGEGKAAAGGAMVSGSGQVAGNRGGASPLLRRSSFFGVRGGDAKVTNR
jgi:hypothetical protein